MLLRLLLFIPIGLCIAKTYAWNALGHKVVAEIAWRQLEPKQRQSIVDTLRRHPRFDADFAANRITILDIVAAFDSPLEPSLPDVPGIQGHVRKRLLTTLELTAAAARRELQKLTIADLQQLAAVRS